jgi:hypothetical protein
MIRPVASRFRARPVLLAGSIAALVLAAAPWAVASDTAEERFEKSYDLTGIQKVRVQNVNGAVHVETWEKPELSLVAVKRVKGTSSVETLKETEIRVQKSGSTLEIETVLPKSRGWGLFSWWRSRVVEVGYELKLPAAIAVQVETVNGRILAERRSGPLVLNTVNGTIRVVSQEGPVRANTVNGSVEVTFTGPVRKAELETVNGSVTVTGARESSIRYNLQTVNGRIRSEFAALTVEGKWGPKEARGEFNGGREALSVETINGEVRLQVADASTLPR